jgi:radical SAM protein with 4Fe4S-binding SPASM domain
LLEKRNAENDKLETVGFDSLRVSRFLARKNKDPVKILGEALGKPFLAYRELWDRAKNFFEAPPFPLHVDYELARKCNLRCPMCPMGDGGEPAIGPAENGAAALGPESGVLTPDAVKALIDEGAREGQKAMGFGGLWEPLLSDDLPWLVARGRDKGFVDVMFNTNGTLLRRELGKRLAEAGLTRIMISVDAVSEKTRGLMRPGVSLKRVEENIMDFLDVRGKRKLPLVRLSFLVTSLNEAELPAFLEKWEDKVDFLSIQRYGNFNPKSPGLFPENPPGDLPGGSCAQPFKRLLVTHEGKVLPCCDLSGTGLVLGDIREDSLKAVWTGEAMKRVREEAKKETGDHAPGTACQTCKSKYRRPRDRSRGAVRKGDDCVSGKSPGEGLEPGV